MVQLDETLVDTLLQKLDTKLDEKLTPIQERLTKLEEGQKRIEAKLDREVEDMAENIGIIMAKMPDGKKIDKRLDRIEDVLHLPPVS